MKKNKLAINCSININGTPSVWPLELVIEGDEYFAVLADQQHRIKLNKEKVQKPAAGLVAWNYSEPITIQTSAKAV